jgi:hypothetical protein
LSERAYSLAKEARNWPWDGAAPRLYAADITKLRVIDLETGKVIESIPTALFS